MINPESTQLVGAPNPAASEGLLPQTVELYERVANGIIRRACGHTEEIDYRVVADHIKGLVSTTGLTKNTIRTYCAALRFVFNAYPHAETESALTVLAGIAGVPGRRSASTNRRGSTQRTKEVPPPDFAALTTYLVSDSHRVSPSHLSAFPWSAFAARWLAVGIITGARPGEWEDAQLSDDGEGAHNLVLKTLKRKATQISMSLLPENRSVPIGDDEVATVATHLAIYQRLRLSMTVNEIRREASARLAKASRRLWPDDESKRYTLYSARHQAAANKRYLFPLEQVSEWMGHTPETNMLYGGQARAWSEPSTVGQHSE